MQFLKLKQTQQYIRALSFNTSDSGKNTDGFIIKKNIVGSLNEQIEKLLKEKGLEDIFLELDMHKAPTPVSFDFKLLKLHVKNYRSIEDITINFDNQADVIYFHGLNGSGKSSILKALITGLMGDPYLKKKNRRDKAGNIHPCSIEVELISNGTYYGIYRAPGKTKLFINNEEDTSGSGSKKAAEERIATILPFTKHLNMFFFPSNTHYFDHIDREELIKTVFNLDMLDYLYEYGKKAALDSESQMKIMETDLIKLNTEKATLESQIAASLAEVNQVNITEDDIKIVKNNLSEASKLYEGAVQLFNGLKTDEALLIQSQQALSRFPEESEEEIRKFLKIYETIEDFNSKLSYTNTMKTSTTQEIANHTKLLEMLNAQKKQCPHCGKDIYSEDTLNSIAQEQEAVDKAEKNLDEIQAALNELVPQIKEFTTLNSDYVVYQGAMIKTTNNIKQKYEYHAMLQNIQNKAMMEASIRTIIENMSVKKAQYDDLAAKLKTITNGMKFKDYENEANDKIMKFSAAEAKRSMYLSLTKRVAELNTTIENETKKKEEIEVKISKYKKLKDLFDPKNLNSMTYIFIEMILKSISSDNIKFSSTKQNADGNERFKINCSMDIVEDMPIDYDEASDGQKTLMDLIIICKVIDLMNGCGLLVLDESFANLDETKYSRILDFFKETKCRDILITSHNPNFEGSTRNIECAMNEDGVTTIKERT